MNMKINRQSKLIELISKYNIETQEELTSKLNDLGFLVTQTTVSRDIRELKITKVQIENGKQKYAIIDNSDILFLDRLYRIFKDAVMNIDFANNLVIIKTLDGMAMGVAASLDGMNFSEIMGTIAGDDTIFCVLRTEEEAINLIQKLSSIIKNKK